MNRTPRILLLGLLSIWLPMRGATRTAGAESSVAVMSAGQLRAELLRTQEKIHSLRVVYRGESAKNDKSPLGYYIHRTFSAKEPCYLFHDSTHGSKSLDWKDDPGQEIAYLNAERLFNVWPMNRRYFEKAYAPNHELPGTLRDELYFLRTGIWPMRGRITPRPFGRPHMLFEVAASEKYCNVRPFQELVDGHLCHVLEYEGFDSLWLDTKRGCSLMRRECALVKNSLAERTELGGHREIAPGIWLPNWMRYTQFDFLAPTDTGRARRVTDSKIDVLEMSVNDVADAIFVFQPPAGAISLNVDFAEKSYRQTQPYGLDHLDNLAEWLGKVVQIPKRDPQHSMSPALIAAALSLIIVMEVRRRRSW